MVFAKTPALIRAPLRPVVSVEQRTEHRAPLFAVPERATADGEGVGQGWGGCGVTLCASIPSRVLRIVIAAFRVARPVVQMHQTVQIVKKATVTSRGVRRGPFPRARDPRGTGRGTGRWSSVLRPRGPGPPPPRRAPPRAPQLAVHLAQASRRCVPVPVVNRGCGEARAGRGPRGPPQPTRGAPNRRPPPSPRPPPGGGAAADGLTRLRLRCFRGQHRPPQCLGI